MDVADPLDLALELGLGQLGPHLDDVRARDDAAVLEGGGSGSGSGQSGEHGAQEEGSATAETSHLCCLSLSLSLRGEIRLV